MHGYKLNNGLLKYPPASHRNAKAPWSESEACLYRPIMHAKMPGKSVIIYPFGIRAVIPG